MREREVELEDLEAEQPGSDAAKAALRGGVAAERVEARFGLKRFHRQVADMYSELGEEL